MTEASSTLETTVFNCPRCNSEVTERFWGPCTACRQELTANAAKASGGDGTGDTGSFEAAKFEPAMHVTPNHVATKD